jgi:hypothetical protein
MEILILIFPQNLRDLCGLRAMLFPHWQLESD